MLQLQKAAECAAAHATAVSARVAAARAYSSGVAPGRKPGASAGKVHVLVVQTTAIFFKLITGKYLSRFADQILQ